MRNIQLLIVSIILSTSMLYARIAEEAFIKKHLIDDHLASILDKHSYKLERLLRKIHRTERQKNGVWRFKWLPGYYVKYNVNRIIQKELLDSAIKDHALDLIHTPEKYFYHIKGRPTELHSLNYVVISKDVRARTRDQEKRLSLEHAQQMTKAIETSGHCSTYAQNYLILPDGRVSFIDTDGTFANEISYKGLIRLLERDNLHRFGKAAREHIVSRIIARYPYLAPRRKNEALKFLAGWNRHNQIKNRTIRSQLYELLREL